MESSGSHWFPDRPRHGVAPDSGRGPCSPRSRAKPAVAERRTAGRCRVVTGRNTLGTARRRPKYGLALSLPDGSISPVTPAHRNSCCTSGPVDTKARVLRARRARLRAAVPTNSSHDEADTAMASMAVNELGPMLTASEVAEAAPPARQHRQAPGGQGRAALLPRLQAGRSTLPPGGRGGVPRPEPLAQRLHQARTLPRASLPRRAAGGPPAALPLCHVHRTAAGTRLRRRLVLPAPRHAPSARVRAARRRLPTAGGALRAARCCDSRVRCRSVHGSCESADGTRVGHARPPGGASDVPIGRSTGLQSRPAAETVHAEARNDRRGGARKGPAAHSLVHSQP